MKNILIKCDKDTKQFRKEAYLKALEFENEHLKEKALGSYNGVLWVAYNEIGQGVYQIYVYHTKTQIVSVLTSLMTYSK